MKSFHCLHSRFSWAKLLIDRALPKHHGALHWAITCVHTCILWLGELGTGRHWHGRLHLFEPVTKGYGMGWLTGCYHGQTFSHMAEHWFSVFCLSVRILMSAWPLSFIFFWDILRFMIYPLLTLWGGYEWIDQAQEWGTNNGFSIREDTQNLLLGDKIGAQESLFIPS